MASFERIRIIGFRVEFEHGCRSSFIAGHVMWAGTLVVKNVIVDDFGADASTDFPAESSKTAMDLPCYSHASADLKLSMNAKNLITGGNDIAKRSMFSSSSGTVTNFGIIFGHIDINNVIINMSKIAIIAYSDIPGKIGATRKGNGFLVGYQNAGTKTNINETYINANLTGDSLGMLHDIGAGSLVVVTVALEGNWDTGTEKGFVNCLNGGTINFIGSFNINLNAA